MHIAILTVLLVAALAALVWLLAKSFRRITGGQRAAQAHFESRYGSVDAMLVLCELDFDRLRAMRDKGRLERWDAIRDVMRLENVPESVATQFIDRL